MKGEYMFKLDNELPMSEGNYVVKRDYEWCPICLGTGVKQEKYYNEHCSYCNGSQDSAYGLFNYAPGSEEWNTYYGRNDKLVHLPEALDPSYKYKLRKE